MAPTSPDGRSAGSAFADYLGRHHQLIEDALGEKAACPLPRTAPQMRDELDRYLYGPLARFTASGGKRTRPALCLLGAEAVGGRAEDALSVATAIENFQSAALVHDDIADRSELRRGKPCVYVTEGVGVAINVGDLALTTVTRQILDDASLADATKLRVLREVVAMEERTLEGQALDLGWARDGRWDISVDDYLYMASHKTAYYSAAVPLAAGAICGGGTDAQVKALRSFGMSAGLAFQLQDDLLNLVGDPARQGKDFRSDITEGKRTLVAVWALTHLPEAAATELRTILSSSATDEATLARAVELMGESGAIDHTRAYARRLADEAKSHLASADFLPEAGRTLLSMADFFVERLG
ncbi:MAG: polyprenyl synthetase family protein [Parafannyhessea sp.]|uniref:polyprenyl synthetase family protein n=1 Tax=Parafannyhessea sp. TaxID=2847324 RepID=UPI003F0D3F54